MKITWHIEGGFAHLLGLAQPRTVDVDAMPDARGQTLRRLAERALAQSKVPRRSRARGADRQICMVTIEDATRVKQFAIEEPCEDEALAALVGALRALRS